MNSEVTRIFLLAIAVIASSVAVVYAEHHGRKLFVELQSLGYEKDRMDVEWGQLQLEQSTLTTQGQVEHDARTRLGMIIPAPDRMVIVKP
ncbi:MAG: cell division protein FtsL [Gammaproteobacteria bacterium]|nr:MAG: cell division protein FtsL [Gammaproteobacteria bacterium]